MANSSLLGGGVASGEDEGALTVVMIGGNEYGVVVDDLDTFVGLHIPNHNQ